MKKKRMYCAMQQTCEAGGKITLCSAEGYLFVLPVLGKCSVSAGEQKMACSIHDLLFLGPHQSAVLSPYQGHTGFEVVGIEYSQTLLKELSDEDMDLAAYFASLPPSFVMVKSECVGLSLSRNLMQNLVHLWQDPPFLAMTIYERGILSVLIAMLARACGAEALHHGKSRRRTLDIDSMLAYIATHITEEITLDRLEKQFFISKAYISREFKKAVGQTVHSYILKAKLDLCRSYIAQGMPIAEVYKVVEIGGYNHFFRAFKKEYGVTPKEYCRSIAERSGEKRGEKSGEKEMR